MRGEYATFLQSEGRVHYVSTETQVGGKEAGGEEEKERRRKKRRRKRSKLRKKQNLTQGVRKNPI